MTSLTLAVPLTVVSVLGLLLNIYILFIVLATKQVQTANNLLLLHLGAVDALLCVTFLVFSVPEMIKGWPWLALGAPCNFHGFLFTLLHPVALWTVCGLNWDRYYAITSPLHYGSVVKPKKVAIGLGFAWFVSLILCIPPLFLIAPYRFNPGLGGCAPDFAEREGTIWYSLAYTTFTLLLPAILILGCNLRVLMIARYHRHRIASAIFEVTISAQVTITHQRNPFLMATGNIFRGRRAISTVLQLIGSFLILYLPYYSVILWESSSSVFGGDRKASSTRLHSLLVSLASVLLNCSPPVNGLLYGVKSKMLRKTFRNYWRKQMTKSEVNQEIQARTPSTCGSRRPSLTPMGSVARPVCSNLQRRSSQLYLERQCILNKYTAQRVSSELNWRPQSTSGIDIASFEFLEKSESLRRSTIPKHYSCNVLRASSERDIAVDTHGGNTSPGCKTLRLAISKAFSNRNGHLLDNNGQFPGQNLTQVLWQKIFGESHSSLEEESAIKKIIARQTLSASATRRSPRILITRAFSEEGETSNPSIKSEMKCYSTSTTFLADEKWKKLQYEDDNEEKDIQKEEELQQTTDEEGSKSLMLGGNLINTVKENLLLKISDFEANPIKESQKKMRKYGDQNGSVYLCSWPVRKKCNSSDGRYGVVCARSVVDLSQISEFKL